MDWVEFTGKNVNEALTDALIKLETTSDKVQYEVIEKESNGILGLFSKPARIRVMVKDTIPGRAEDFLKKIFKEMEIEAKLDIQFNEEEGELDIDIGGEDMGILIGKRGQTLDSLQYLTSLVVNKGNETYLKVKIDTENYRERRKETLENLAKNISFKVKRNKRPVSLEPMNPYERRIIHSALQYDKFVETHSEGDEPYRHVVVTLRKGYKDYNSKPGYSKPYNKEYANKSYNNKDYHSKPYGSRPVINKEEAATEVKEEN